MRLNLVFAVAIAQIAFIVGYEKSYEGFKVYSVISEKLNDVESLKWWEHNPSIDFWSLPGINKTSNILVHPDHQKEFEEFLSNENFNHKILIENVQNTMKSPYRSRRYVRDSDSSKFHFQNGNFTASFDSDFSHYWTLPEIEDYINFLAQSTDLHVKKVIIGKSYEGRNIEALTISLDETVGNKPILFMDSGIHAREWAGHMSVLYLLHELVENYAANLDLLKEVDWVIVPVVNPDGYAYTFDGDRLWRKNRRPIDDRCVGVDLNRNFRYEWKAAAYGTTPCSQLYPGPSPHSEPETQALADFMVSFKNKLKLYVSMHSYASFLIYPYSFDFVYISNWKQHQELCQIYVDTLNNITRFTPFDYGHSASEFYLAAGVSDDHVIGEAGAKMSIVVELPGGGSAGFDFPEEDIEDLVKETFQGLRKFGHYVAENFYI